MEIKATNEAADLVLIPRFSYSSATGAEVNLENSYVRVPMGIWSIYGGETNLAASFYYRSNGKGFFGGISQEKHIGSFGNSLKGARTITAGIIFSKLGSDHNTDVTVSYINAIDDMAEYRYQTWSLKNERTIRSGSKLGYILSNNDRTRNGDRIANYSTLRFFYKLKFKTGLRGVFSLGVTYENEISPVFSFKLNMDL